MWPDPDNDGEQNVQPFRATQLYHEWYGRVAMGNPNDYVIAISAHPGYTGVSGSGKTTLAGGLADRLDFSDGGFQAEDQFTVDAGVLAYDLYGKNGPGAALIGDEMQGTAANTNLNSKRSMKTEALDTYNTIAGNRKGRKTLILVFQTLSKAMKDMFDFVDAWLLIVDDVNYRCNHYKVLPEAFNFESNKTKTPRVETLTWGPLPQDDRNYRVMEEKKDQANAGEREFGSDADGEQQQSIPKELRDQQIKAAYERGQSQTEIAKHWDLTQQAISNIVNDD